MQDGKLLSSRVLVVDDAKVNQMICKKILQHLGLQVDVVDNGRLAIEMCKKNTYNLIIMDMEMPDLDGIETTKHIREKSLSFAPVIALTANTQTEAKQRCNKAGMNGYITKPISKELLTLEIGKILR
jgi:CheY-like chemotaxis protein